MGRKPFPGTVAGNVLAHGTGALNIDGCRVEGGARPLVVSDRRNGNEVYGDGLQGSRAVDGGTTAGRWPANVLLDESQADELDGQSGNVKGATSNSAPATVNGFTRGARGVEKRPGYADNGGASRFFYCAKAPKAERPNVDGVQHPTVKPLAVMRWLLRLVTPPGGITLDTFAGSGATVEAALLEGLRPVAIEREHDYLPLILQRVERRNAHPATLDFGGAA